MTRSGTSAVLDPQELRLTLRELLVRELAFLFGEAGIPVMPLKGALFAYWLYESPAQRFGDDIDVLVPESCFAAAIRCLQSRGFALLSSPCLYQRTLIPPAARIAIDLHQTLFPRGYYSLSTAGLFQRGVENRTWFGSPIVVPDPYDAYAHLIGHAAAGHFAGLPPTAKQDLMLLAKRFRLDERRCADHLNDCGLSRAARYTLGRLGPVDEFATRVLGYLPRDPIGNGLVRLAHTLARKFDYMSRPALCSAYLTNASVQQTLRLCIARGMSHVRREQS